ncbi:CRISPR type III-A/MTUBE-associated RAMP protein Csm4 [Xenococcus sp. PCC 7305]|uniref:type III-A CRISPR-associated RAMP protein Csm4 n=1 Tax=Xenococcus sp. PCC 7305 TaxID=102125 RepID=UPI0002AC2F7C|nr:type III-A CRISPR-associated RAMP protein Csm4 [Xenococcus sp. PCC 7305]ELS02936.1 CRISPR type III-A/MTUBE-associated RAMP protein Csm4 [Xenococcus sp. PCC 7305]
MSNWRLVRLDFSRTPVHFGEVGIGIEETSERVRSDTLFSALINTYVRLFGVEDVTEFLELFPIENKSLDKQERLPPVQISSTFIYTYEKDQTKDLYRYYLPRPANFPPGYPEYDLEFFKSYKKLKYLPLDIWRRWYQESGFSTDNKNSDRTELIAQTKTKETKGALAEAGVFNYSKTYSIATYPKVSIDRRTAATNFYHTGFTQFNCEQNDKGKEKRSGLYFLLYFPQENPKLEHRLNATLNLLGEDGLGGERSSGAGRFEVEYWGDLPPDWEKIVNFQNAQHHCLLSLFWRKSLEDNFLDNSSYELIERGGWIGSPFSGRQLRRKKIHMFAEGSVFNSQPSGQLALVTPDGFNKHKIYRSGISLSIPINVKPESSE